MRNKFKITELKNVFILVVITERLKKIFFGID